ncbi:MAG: SusC/RagA family TonB-linked outer membrane protein, partial [Agriterribacter sp.]
MKFLATCLLAFALNVSANGFSQTVTLNERSISYQQLFKLINEQTGYQVFYKANVLDSNEKLRLSINKLPVDQVLSLVLKDKPLVYSIVDRSIVIKKVPGVALPTGTMLLKEAFATVKGVVKDHDDQPLPDVSVTVKGTSKGTLTQRDGSFSIDVKAGESLVFSRVGYKPVTIKPGTQTFFTIKMELDQAIGDEVVVVGYGKRQKKALLTGAVSVIGGKELQNRPVTNAVAALQGLAPGLVVTRNTGQPGREGWSLLIRGLSSVNGNGSPLVIVDGAPGSLSTLNPNDIETISVLKDAAEAAIYGAEAANGVIIVTTRIGSTKKLSVGYNALFTTNKAFNVPERNPSWLEAEQLNLARANQGQASVWNEQQIRWMQDPDTNYVLNPNGTWGYYENLDFAKILLRNKTRSAQHDLSLSGKAGNTRYLFSGGYYTQKGILLLGPDSHKRINARLNISTELSKVFSFSSNIDYTNLNTLYPIASVDGDYGLLYRIYQLRTLAPLYLPNNDGSYAGSYDSSKYSNAGGGVAYAIMKDGGYNSNRTHRINGVFKLKATNVLKGLDLTLQYSPRLFVGENTALTRQLKLWSTATSFSYLNPTDNISKSDLITTTQNFQFLTDYDYKRGGHHFHLLGGYQFDQYELKTVSANATNIISSELPSVNYLANPITNPPTIADNYDSKVLISFFGKLNYDYVGKYVFQVTVRNDASSQLAPGYRSKTFPSASAAWNIHKENWFPHTEAINSVKLKASWGKLGNSSVLGYYDYLQLLNRGSVYPFNNQRANSFYVGAYASPEKGWETLESKNIGMEAAFFRDRLTVGFDYYTRDNINMLVQPTVPDIFGLTAAARNIASMRSWGWELEFKWVDAVSEDFVYWVGGNLSDQKNKVTAFLGRTAIGLGERRVIEGFPLNTIWGYRTDGFFGTDTSGGITKVSLVPTKTGPGDIKYLDLNKDGKISVGGSSLDDPGDLVLLGETSPHYSFGFNVGALIKGIDFSAFFQGVLKRKMYVYPYAAMPYLETWRQGWVSQNDFWTPENQDAKLPRPYVGGTHNTATSDFWIQDANYIRLKNLQI